MSDVSGAAGHLPLLPASDGRPAALAVDDIGDLRFERVLITLIILWISATQ
jgi:hypothetical protein